MSDEEESNQGTTLEELREALKHGELTATDLVKFKQGRIHATYWTSDLENMLNHESWRMNRIKRYGSVYE